MSEDSGEEEEDGEDHVVSEGREDHSECENKSGQLFIPSASRIVFSIATTHLHDRS